MHIKFRKSRVLVRRVYYQAIASLSLIKNILGIDEKAVITECLFAEKTEFRSANAEFLAFVRKNPQWQRSKAPKVFAGNK